ncbi:hypothetical protein HDU67_007796 [Dinochytrium kinnereticum]|nr:hypothetical protein HDU67_007796 [Dinochytrium kinnereticum]
MVGRRASAECGPKLPVMDPHDSTASKVGMKSSIPVEGGGISLAECARRMSMADSHDNTASKLGTKSSIQVKSGRLPLPECTRRMPVADSHDNTSSKLRKKGPTPLYKLVDDNRRLRDLVSHLAIMCDRMEADLMEAREQRDMVEEKLILAGPALEKAAISRERAIRQAKEEKDMARKAWEEVGKGEIEKDVLRRTIEDLRKELEAESQLLIRVIKERDLAKRDLSNTQTEVSRLEDDFIAAGVDAPSSDETSTPVSRVAGCVKKALEERETLRVKLDENGSRLKETEVCLELLETWRKSMEWHRGHGASYRTTLLSQMDNEAPQTSSILDKLGKVGGPSKSLQSFNHSYFVFLS